MPLDPARLIQLAKDYQANVEALYLAGRTADGDTAARAFFDRWPRQEVAEFLATYEAANATYLR
ncbi:hypothetical protein [Streptomyces sp. NPDC001389]|uniref:hypothetical protein n=1 Tax=Streptomyces sp. NPDC001389 TaxID=3364569 RepID=UPI0036B40041